MPYVKFLLPYPGYTVGQVVDLPGKLTWRLKALHVVVRVEAPTFGTVAGKKTTAKKAAKKIK